MADPVAVAFVSSHAKAGGSEGYLETLLAALGPEERAAVVSLEHGPLVDRLLEQGIGVAVLPTGARPWSLARAALRLRHHVRAADIVHANGVKAALVCALAGVPFVWVKHDFSWDGPLGSLIARRARLVVGVSEAVTRALPARARVRVIWTGLDTPDAGDVTRTPRTVVAVGRIHSLKGQLDLVEAAAHVPGATFLLAGSEDPSEPEYAVRVRERVAALGLADRVHLLGHRDDAAALIAAADVLALPSLEGFGLVAVEAMLLGTPVVGYDHGALPQVVGEAGLLVRPGDARALAAALTRVLDDGALRATLAERGRERAQAQFSKERWVTELRDAYREAST